MTESICLNVCSKAIETQMSKVWIYRLALLFLLFSVQLEIYR